MINRAWTAILLGGCFETAWAMTMKQSEGFTVLSWTLVTLFLLGCSTVLLDQGMKRGIPVGTGYAVWVGIGAVGSIVMGILVYHEPLTAVRLFFAMLIVAGVVGLEMSQTPTKEEEPTPQPATVVAPHPAPVPVPLEAKDEDEEPEKRRRGALRLLIDF